MPLDTNALLTKVLEALNSRIPDVSPGPRDSLGHGHLRVRGAPQDPLCLWCGKKGHLLIDCPGPAPNAVAQEARDLLRAARASRAARNDGRQVRRLTSAAASAASDDDMEDPGDPDPVTSVAATYAVIQAYFHGHMEPTKQ